MEDVKESLVELVESTVAMRVLLDEAFSVLGNCRYQLIRDHGRCPQEFCEASPLRSEVEGLLRRMREAK